MRVTVKLYRATQVPTEHLKACAGLEPTAANDKADKAIRERFGPHLAFGFHIFWPEEPGFRTTVVGMEAMSFDLVMPDATPKAAEGLVNCDPLDPKDIDRMDGALRCELQRMGIWTEPDDYQWRARYEVK